MRECSNGRNQTPKGVAVFSQIAQQGTCCRINVKNSTHGRGYAVKNIHFVDQSIPVPDEFRAAVVRAAHVYFPRKREFGAVDRYLLTHVECLEKAIRKDFPDCHVRATATPDEMRFTIDLSTGDTGFAYITLPITFKSDTLYVDGAS